MACVAVNSLHVHSAALSPRFDFPHAGEFSRQLLLRSSSEDANTQTANPQYIIPLRATAGFVATPDTRK